jgi:hypothetical protein
VLRDERPEVQVESVNLTRDSAKFVSTRLRIAALAERSLVFRTGNSANLCTNTVERHEHAATESQPANGATLRTTEVRRDRTVDLAGVRR